MSLSPDAILALASRHGLTLELLTLVRPYLPVQVPDWQIHTHELIAYPPSTANPLAPSTQSCKPTAGKLTPKICSTPICNPSAMP